MLTVLLTFPAVFAYDEADAIDFDELEKAGVGVYLLTRLTGVGSLLHDTISRCCHVLLPRGQTFRALRPQSVLGSQISGQSSARCGRRLQ